ncbi:hypothetical protein [Flavobacterium tructae]|uniref:hypothetical protein n=1 Tax=Flavobacterium tructae TaxID=1114873 RepID=UPI0035A9273C
MRKLKKMSFEALIENITREEKKVILAGSGSMMNGSSYSSGGGGGSYSGNMGYYATDRGMSSQFTPAGTLLYSPNGNYSSPSISSNQNSYGYGGSTYNSNYGSTGSTLSNSVGWTNNGNSIKTTSQSDISRVLNFMFSNTVSNTAVTWNMVAGFLNNELTASGRAINDAQYGAIQLNNVNVVNNYKGPSTIPQGMVYENGMLTLGVTMGSHGVLVGASGGAVVYPSSNSGQALADDYIFSDKGSLLKMQDAGSGHNIKVSIGGQLYNLSDLNTSALQGNAAAVVSNIATYFATKAGISIGFVGTDNNSESSDSVLAFTRSDGTVYLNTNGGINKLLDNYDNLTSVLKHEQLHQIDFANPNKSKDLETHTNVYLRQFSDSSFAKTTDEFKLYQISSLVNYLMNMDRNNYSRNTVINKINEFNNLKNGYVISNDTAVSLNPSQLNLLVKYGTNVYETIYKPVKN